MKFIRTTFLFSILSLCYISCKKNEGASNPFVERKTKPSQEIKEGYNKAMKKQNRAAKRQMRRTRKMLYGTPE